MSKNSHPEPLSVLHKLPPELIQLIIKVGTEDLDRSAYREFCLNAALVHRNWTKPAQHQLQEEIYIDTKTLSPLTIGLLESPTLGLYPIRRIFWTQRDRQGDEITMLLYILGLLKEREGLKRLDSLHLSFSGEKTPAVSIEDIVRAVPSLNHLGVIGRDVNPKFADVTPTCAQLTTLRIANSHAIFIDKRYAFLDRLNRLTSEDMVGMFHTVENLGGLTATSGLIDRLRYLRLRRWTPWPEIASTCVFPHLEELRIDMPFSGPPFLPDHFILWEMPALTQVSTFVTTQNEKTLRKFKEWVTSPAFRTVTRWDTHFLNTINREGVDFKETCEARGVKVTAMRLKTWDEAAAL